VDKPDKNASPHNHQRLQIFGSGFREEVAGQTQIALKVPKPGYRYLD